MSHWSQRTSVLYWRLLDFCCHTSKLLFSKNEFFVLLWENYCCLTREKCQFIGQLLEWEGGAMKITDMFLSPSPSIHSRCLVGILNPGGLIVINCLIIFLFLFSFLSPQILGRRRVATHMWLWKCVRKEFIKCACGVGASEHHIAMCDITYSAIISKRVSGF